MLARVGPYGARACSRAQIVSSRAGLVFAVAVGQPLLPTVSVTGWLELYGKLSNVLELSNSLELYGW